MTAPTHITLALFLSLAPLLQAQQGQIPPAPTLPADLPPLPEGMEIKTWQLRHDFFAGNDGKLLSATRMLKQCGVLFPEGASANYDKRTKTLTVINEPEQIQMVDAAILDYARQLPVIYEMTWCLPNGYYKELRSQGLNPKKDSADFFCKEFAVVVFSARMAGRVLTVRGGKGSLERLDGIFQCVADTHKGRMKKIGKMRVDEY